MPKPILNIDDAVPTEHGHGAAFAARIAPLASPLGARSMGANLTVVPPGKAAWPYHHHHANEEHFFVVRGTGTLRFGSETFPVRAGDYIVTPAGGPELAHQLINTGADDLAYLALSTRLAPEIVGYPDSGKVGARAAPTADGGPGQRFLISVADLERLDYWEGEDGAAVRALVDTAGKGGA
jgi:uncharacterized cupin superfamily protein